jgi:monoamine oxidase
MGGDAITRRTLLVRALGGAAALACGAAACGAGDAEQGEPNGSGSNASATDNSQDRPSAEAAEASDATASASGSLTTSVPTPKVMLRTSWSTDEFARGAYSYLAVGATPEMREVLAAPLGDRVFFAGEATASDHPSTVHGAQASGRRVVDEVIEVADSGDLVVVVGAGAAGIEAAHGLAAAGFEVLVIEARDHVGGRIHAEMVDGLALELGASWVHDVEASDLADQLAQLGISTAPFDYDEEALLGRDGRPIVDIDRFVGPAREAIDAAIDWANDRDEDVSLADALDQSGAGASVDPVALNTFDESEVAAEYGAAAAEMSAWWGFEEGSEGDDLIVLGGYDGIIRARADGLDVSLNRPVSGIRWNDDGVSIVDRAGLVVEADRVIVTVPLGVLKAGAITFEPPLPADKIDAIERIGMGLLDKVWFVFDEAFWTEESLMWNLVAEPGTPYTEWFNLQPLLGRPILLSLIGGPQARDWATRSDDEVKAAALGSLQRFIDAGW